MKTATHKSRCGKWLYKKSSREVSIYESKFLRASPMLFYDTYCGKWRESVIDEKSTVKI